MMRSLVGTAALVAGILLAPSHANAQDRTLERGDATINYVVAGSGRPVVLVHGWALNLREWDDQVVALAPHYRVIAVDRRGYGKSTGNADPTSDPDDIRAVLDTLGIGSAVLIGHSAGADVVSRFAAALPERVDALVLYGGGEPAGFPVPTTQAITFNGLKMLARQHGLDSLFGLITALPQFTPGPHRSAATAARLDSILAGYDGRDLLEDHPPLGEFGPATFDQMRHWRFPVLWVSGEHESKRWLEVADSMTNWMPDGRKAIIRGGGHAVHFDEPARFNAALLAFLAALDHDG